jgi:acetyltransferase-like isoleucine patch superfamily enzyme
MILNYEDALKIYKAKVFLAHNSQGPTLTNYEWLKLPKRLDIPENIQLTIEERTGFYGGIYLGSIGAPSYCGFCTMGSFSYSYSALPLGLTVGRYCSISSGLNFLDSYHLVDGITSSAITFRPDNKLWADLISDDSSPFRQDWHIYNKKSFPTIGNDVWIGKDVTLSMGIKLGTGSIIAAKSVVTKDVPPYCLVAGNPARIIRLRFSPDVIFELLKSSWWNKSPNVLFNMMNRPLDSSIEKFLRTCEFCEEWVPIALSLNSDKITY